MGRCLWHLKNSTVMNASRDGKGIKATTFLLLHCRAKAIGERDESNVSRCHNLQQRNSPLPL